MLLPILKRRRRGQFNPVNLGGCVLWLDGADLSTITNAGSGVIGWADKSGLGNSAVQTTDAQRPVSGTRIINGRNALDFNGTSHRMLLPSGLYSISAGDNTVFMVSAFYNVEGTQNRIWAGADAGTGRWVIHRDQSLDTATAINGTLSVVRSALADDTTQHILGLRRSGTTNGLIMIYDGVQSTAGTAANVTCTSLAIGAQAGGKTYLDGLIGEVIVFNRALSTAEMNYIGRGLKAKWSTPWTDM